MPQLSIFDKKHHRSNKDVTLSIGKDDRITITFRNNSWEKITKGDYIRIWVSNGKIKFADADETTEGRKYKLNKNISNVRTAESTRYVQPTGKMVPDVAEIVKKYNGNSYDLPKTKEINLSAEGIVNKTEITDEDLELHAREHIEKKNIPEPQPDELETRISRFFYVVKCCLKFAQTPEERTAIWYAVAALFNTNKKEGGNA